MQFGLHSALFFLLYKKWLIMINNGILCSRQYNRFNAHNWHIIKRDLNSLYIAFSFIRNLVFAKEL